MVKVQEAENQIVIGFEVYEQRPQDKDLLVPSVQLHQQRLGRVPEMVAGGRFLFRTRVSVRSSHPW
jgi:transposase, IS5 family